MVNSRLSLTPSLSRWERGQAVRVQAMPPALAAVHAALDRAVDKCYRPAECPSDRARVEYLFQLYEHLTTKPKCTRKARN